jgi:hypothetical protein
VTYWLCPVVPPAKQRISRPSRARSRARHSVERARARASASEKERARARARARERCARTAFLMLNVSECLRVPFLDFEFDSEDNDWRIHVDNLSGHVGSDESELLDCPI